MAEYWSAIAAAHGRREDGGGKPGRSRRRGRCEASSGAKGAGAGAEILAVNRFFSVSSGWSERDLLYEFRQATAERARILRVRRLRLCDGVAVEFIGPAKRADRAHSQCDDRRARVEVPTEFARRRAHGDAGGLATDISNAALAMKNFPHVNAEFTGGDARPAKALWIALRA